MRSLLSGVIVAIFGLASTGVAAAEDYPTRAITMIVPFPAGGATDTVARFLAEQMRPILGQPVIIENVAGAAGSIGVGRAARAAGDGYTLSIGTSTTHMLIGALYALPFDLLTDLQPVAQLVQTLRVSFKNHTRIWKRKSFDVSAPTGQISMHCPHSSHSR